MVLGLIGRTNLVQMGSKGIDKVDRLILAGTPGLQLRAVPKVLEVADTLLLFRHAVLVTVGLDKVLDELVEVGRTFHPQRGVRGGGQRKERVAGVVQAGVAIVAGHGVDALVNGRPAVGTGIHVPAHLEHEGKEGAFHAIERRVALSRQVAQNRVRHQAGRHALRLGDCKEWKLISKLIRNVHLAFCLIVTQFT